ncbi:hypothetical protein INF73_21930, partial [Enterobacter cloacae complex sp. P6RS]|uniref:WavE lipopolysaccharide synthesis family protein n=1 Tax=Enterobacter cloacae complex sp. P6RS TaxID=2779588 RepID=UPI001D5DE2FC|nr:hypothetical protein [Enterobacter cloacae complex sp. P6RS]
MNSLSIVIQGPFGTKEYSKQAFLKHLEEMRRLFPLSEIIFSTWKCDSKAQEELRVSLDKLGVVLVISDDPGILEVNDSNGRNRTNVNRLIISTRAGLDVVTRPFTVKMRSDCFVRTRDIVALLEKYISTENGLFRDKGYSVFQQRVL